MKKRILFVNPWIYDFAAYNLRAKPLGLLKIAEYLSPFDVELSVIDCVDAAERKKYCTGKFRTETLRKPELLARIPRRFKRYGIGVDEFAEKVRNSPPVDRVPMTSIMSW